MKIILLACVTVILSGCLSGLKPEYHAKKISSKSAVVSWSGSLYTLRSDDGYRVHVDHADYLAIQVGEVVSSADWTK